MMSFVSFRNEHANCMLEITPGLHILDVYGLTTSWFHPMIVTSVAAAMVYFDTILLAGTVEESSRCVLS